MKKRLPKLKSDAAAEHLLDRDLSDYLNRQNFVPATFEFEPKSKVVNLRVSEGLLRAIKSKSRRRGVPYQKYIRQVLETSLQKEDAFP